MRRRLFWTIAGVAAVTGFLVLSGIAVATQRAGVQATRRQLTQSSGEVVSIINNALEAPSQRPAAPGELFRLLDRELGPTLGRIRVAAGGSELAFGVIAPDGSLRTSAALLSGLDLGLALLEEGQPQFLSLGGGELVLVTPTPIPFQGADATLLVALAREAPVVQISDLGGGLLIVGLGIVLVSAVLARLLSVQVVSRLQPLSDASHRLAGGDLSTRVPELGDPDLSDLGEAFNEMATELEATREREREFILGVGHDLRTPLTTISGYAEALEAGEFESDELLRIGGVLAIQSRQLGRLIEDLSLLARLEQPEFSLRNEPVDVGAHVAEVVAGFRRTADKARVSLSVRAESGLVLEIDPDRLGQIAQNLVENALRHTPGAGRVSVEVRGAENTVMIAVSDTGVGIDPAELPHVFDRHYVGRLRGLRNEGSGLGLSIVRGLAEKMGGAVSAESVPGEGTTITVSLPGRQ
jgi:signal transduction histidine kinase